MGHALKDEGVWGRWVRPVRSVGGGGVPGERGLRYGPSPVPVMWMCRLGRCCVVIREMGRVWVVRGEGGGGDEDHAGHIC